MAAARALAALAVLLCIGTAAALDGDAYQRPKNADCVELDTGAADADQVVLYPPEFILEGDETETGESYTQVTSALGFSVRYYPTYKLVTNNLANETYVLYQCGSRAPELSAFPAGTKMFQVPLTAISAPATVPYAFVDYLGLGDRVHDVSPYVTSPCGQALLACPDGASPDFEQLGNVTLLEEEVSPAIDGMISSDPNAFSKSFTVSAATDPGPLNRAEWIKFVGLFFNLGKQASLIFDSIKAEYEQTKAAAAPAAGAKRPVVAWASHFKYEADENFQLSFDAYQGNLTVDAGGAMLDREALKAVKGVTGSPFDPTSTTLYYAWTVEGGFASKQEAKVAFLAALKQADVVVDETYVMDPASYDNAAARAEWGLSQEDAATVPALANSRVFREDGRVSATGGLDWFEGAIARPDAILKDLVRALYPEKSQGQGFTYLRNLATEKPVVLTADSCDAAEPCSAEPKAICPLVKVCPTGQNPALLTSGTNGVCVYEECGSSAAAAGTSPGNAAAAMAAPAIVLTVLVVAVVELLLNFC